MCLIFLSPNSFLFSVEKLLIASAFEQGPISSPSERLQMTIKGKYSVMEYSRTTNAISLADYISYHQNANCLK